ncbi:MAG: polyamine ABC transporter ATP-binding protein [Opitutae bacterium]|nr:polyamine ABC transporter ATP-binding protein [Opitutae bacterium]
MPGETEKTPVLRVENLKLSYGDYEVLNEVSFEVRDGSCLVIMGGSGCGKSTLLKSLVGLLEPAEGEVYFDSRNLWASSMEDREEILRGFGVLFQGGALWSSMNLLENVSLPLETYTDLSESEVARVAEYKLGLVGLSGYEEFYPSQLSGGMKKRAGLARAMALDPKVLFFDEPSAGLDPLSSRRLDDLINELKESLGMTFVVVSHELASIFEIADDSIFLDAKSKTLLHQGSPASLLETSEHDHVRSFLSRGSSA